MEKSCWLSRACSCLWNAQPQHWEANLYRRAGCFGAARRSCCGRGHPVHKGTVCRHGVHGQEAVHLSPLQIAEGRGLVAVQRWWGLGFPLFWHSWSLSRLHVTGNIGQACSGRLHQQPLGHDGAHTLGNNSLAPAWAGTTTQECQPAVAGLTECQPCRAPAGWPGAAGCPVTAAACCCPEPGVCVLLCCSHWSRKSHHCTPCTATPHPGSSCLGSRSSWWAAPQ